MPIDSDARPQLSVIIASFNARRTIVACLESLRAQRTTRDFEVIVVDSGTDGTAELIRERYPEVGLISSAERLFPGKARNVAIAVARADIVASIDADCRADPEWVDQVIAAHADPHVAIAGPVGSANPESCVGQAYYFCELANWMPGTAGGWIDDAPGANVSYKKSVFTKFGTYLCSGYCSDTEMHWRIGRNGFRILFVPTILVYHDNPSDFRALTGHQMFHGRAFARVRVRYGDFPLWKRLTYLALSPLIPARLFSSIMWGTLKNRMYLGRFLVVWPLVAIGVTCWSAGEAVGYAASVFAPGRDLDDDNAKYSGTSDHGARGGR